MAEQSWRADPLHWGHGPHTFEVFLEPTCPFSGKAFGKLDELLAQAGEDKVTVKIRLLSQPWHMYSGVLVRCIVAASTLPEGREAAKKVLATIVAHRDEYEFKDHAGGANMDVTPNQLIARLEEQSGVALREAFGTVGLDSEVRWHTKYARQNGAHVTPTFMVDGLVQPDLGSGDAVSRWLERIEQSQPR